MSRGRESVCIRCGCSDLNACPGPFGEGCSWLVLDRKRGIGICSSCEDLSKRGGETKAELRRALAAHRQVRV